MRVEIQESYPGELAEDPGVVESKIHRAAHAALDQLGIRKGGVVRGGEMQVFDDLSALMAEAYDTRRRQLLADMIGAAHERQG